MKNSFYETDIHEDLPETDTAITRFYDELDFALDRKFKYIKLIVGQGSESGSHQIKDRVIEECNYLIHRKMIKEFICGDSFYEIYGRPFKRIEKRFFDLIPEYERRSFNAGIIYIFI